jgi:hypothetical protein
LETLHPTAKKYLQDIRSPWKLRYYFLRNLPSAAWWGLRIQEVSAQRAAVVIPYNWRTKNPFRSIYFAALAGAGELSTGVLANMARMRGGPISMLVVGQSSEFVKKATTPTVFTCEQGDMVQAVVQKAIETQAAQTLTMESTGRNTAGEVVCKVYITWSFKAKG